MTLRQRLRSRATSTLRKGMELALDHSSWVALGKRIASVPDYYTPIPDRADFDAGFFDREVDMTGVAIDDDVAWGFADKWIAPHLAEFRAAYGLHGAEPAAGRFALLNGSYMAVDAHALYGVVRGARPRRVVEIGSGASTHLIGAALRRNGSGLCTSIDPYPSPWLTTIDRAVVTVRTERVQSVPISFFTELEENDILFIDSSHVVREGNDVLFEYMEVLPRLKPGVLVHIHDISLPRRYPKVYFDSHLYWTEQYLLKAYLTNNSKTEVIWPGNHMMLRYPERLLALVPEIADMRQVFPSAEPTAFWFRVRP